MTNENSPEAIKCSVNTPPGTYIVTSKQSNCTAVNPDSGQRVGLSMRLGDTVDVIGPLDEPIQSSIQSGDPSAKVIQIDSGLRINVPLTNGVCEMIVPEDQLGQLSLSESN